MSSKSLDEYFRFAASTGSRDKNPSAIRVGRFLVTGEVARELRFVEILEKLEFVPVRVEYLWRNSVFEYIGFSPKFRELEQSEMTPQYEIRIRTEGGEIEEVFAVDCDN